jgi:hypothetical protein
MKISDHVETEEEAWECSLATRLHLRCSSLPAYLAKLSPVGLQSGGGVCVSCRQERLQQE